MDENLDLIWQKVQYINENIDKVFEYDNKLASDYTKVLPKLLVGAYSLYKKKGDRVSFDKLTFHLKYKPFYSSGAIYNDESYIKFAKAVDELIKFIDGIEEMPIDRFDIDEMFTLLRDDGYETQYKIYYCNPKEPAAFSSRIKKGRFFIKLEIFTDYDDDLLLYNEISEKSMEDFKHYLNNYDLVLKTATRISNIFLISKKDSIIEPIKESKIQRYVEFNERYREEKKPSGFNLQKRIYLSKIDLEKICDELNLNINNLKFLSFGSFGNAYKIGDKVLKITKDRREAEAAFNLLNIKNEHLVTYYDVFRYNLRDGEVYVLLMDYVETFEDYLNNIKYENREEFIDKLWDLCTILYENWTKISNKEEYIEIIDEYYESSELKFYIDLFYELYISLKEMSPNKAMDFHIWNLGFKNKKLVLFDVNSLNNVRKFDKPRLVK